MEVIMPFTSRMGMPQSSPARSVSLGFPGPGGSGDAATSEAKQQSSSQSSGGSYFSNPELALGIARGAGGLAQSMASQYDDWLKNPTGQAPYQSSLKGILGLLAPGLAQARIATQQQQAAAGGGNIPTSYAGRAERGLESGVARNTMEGASRLLATLYPSVAQGMFAPISQADDLMNALKLQQQQSQQTASSSSQSRTPIPA
jgi:hypothetical protein